MKARKVGSMAVKQRGTYRHSHNPVWTVRECRPLKLIRPIAFMSEVDRTALRCSEIVLDAGEQGYDSWEIAKQIRNAFGL